jgi:anti-sigma regulatory factor (Ser/Thr protein kinase)
MIVVGELVTNAVRHAPRVPDGHVVVTVVRQPHGLRIEVRDPGNGFVPTTDARDDGGLGLRVIDRIARDWGIRGGDCTVVWCVRAIAPGPPSGPSARNGAPDN